MKRDYPITIGGKSYLLRYNYDALELIETLTGQAWPMAIVKLAQGSFVVLKIIFYAGLKKHHPETELKELGDLLDVFIEENGSLAKVTEIIMDGMDQATGGKLKKLSELTADKAQQLATDEQANKESADAVKKTIRSKRKTAA